MHISVYIEREQKKETVEVAPKATAQALLQELHINPETVLIVRKGSVILPETKLQDKDELKLLSVISGG